MPADVKLRLNTSLGLLWYGADPAKPEGGPVPVAVPDPALPNGDYSLKTEDNKDASRPYKGHANNVDHWYGFKNDTLNREGHLAFGRTSKSMVTVIDPGLWNELQVYLKKHETTSNDNRILSGTLTVTDLPKDDRLPLSGSVGRKDASSPPDNKILDVRRVQSRLRELGFRGGTKRKHDLIVVDGDPGAKTVAAIKLFQSIIKGSLTVGGDGIIDVDKTTHKWLRRKNAPRWRLMPPGNAKLGYKNYERTVATDYHDYGTDWMASFIENAGLTYKRDYLDKVNAAAKLITVNDVSFPAGGRTPDHTGHQTGLDVDFRIPTTSRAATTSTTEPDYDRNAMRAILRAFNAQPRFRIAYLGDYILAAERLCYIYPKHLDHLHIGIWADATKDPIVPKRPDRAALLDEGIELSSDFEEDVEHLYLDSKRRVSVGWHHRLANLTEAQSLPFAVRESGARATADQIKKDFDAVRAGGDGTQPSSHYKDLTKLDLVKTERTRLFRVDMGRAVQTLWIRFPLSRGEKWSPMFPGYLALCDLAFDIGEGFIGRFPKLVKAVRKREWNDAATESARSDVTPERNQKIADLLKEVTSSFE